MLGEACIIAAKRITRRPQRRRSDAGSEKAGFGESLSRWRHVIAACAIALVALAAYHNSFRGPFIFDDTESIKENLHIRRLWPIWRAMWAPPNMTVSGRPMVSLSLAVNYRLSGLHVWSYHAMNLVIHVLAAIALFGVVRRTLRTERLRRVSGGASYWLALACALLWLTHPLQTESVTYVIQRAESLMGLFFLLTLYLVIRGCASPAGRRRWWFAGSAAACAVGMGCKEVMATAPVIVLMYDRVFVGRSFKEILRRRWGLYAGLAASWVVLLALLATNPRGSSAGFGLQPVTPLEYALTQCQVIPHYLRLSFWPSPLVLDYLWPVARSFGQVAYHAAGLALLLAGTVVALRYRPALGFLAASFFVILGPTSSFVPIVDPAFEHRMYLPLAAIVTGVVCLGYLAVRKLPGGGASKVIYATAGAAISVAILGAFIFLTSQRNDDYRSAAAMWNETLQKRPHNVRAYNNRAVSLEQLGRYDMAIRDYTVAIRLAPEYAVSYHGRGVSYSKKGLNQQAIRDFSKAIEFKGDYSKAYNNRGIAYTNTAQYDQAIADFRKAIGIDPYYAKAYNNRAITYTRMRLYDKAIEDCNKAIELDRNYDKAYNNRGVAYGGKGMHDLALRDFTTAIELNPEYATAYSARGLACVYKGQYRRAIEDFDMALRLDPTDQVARRDRDTALRLLREQGGPAEP